MGNGWFTRFLSIEPKEITKGVWLGSLESADEVADLKRKGITAIIDLSGEPYEHRTDLFRYLTIQIDDFASSDISQFFEATNRFIQKELDNGGAVLVHCLYGVSRSSTIILAYMIGKQHLTLREALLLARRVQPRIKPNAGFLMQLKEYESKERQKQKQKQKQKPSKT